MNKAIISGRLTREPELRETSKSSVASFTVAVDGYNSETKEKSAEFLPVKAFGQQAEYVARYGAKGREVSVVGRLHVNKWEDKEGNKRERTEIVAQEVELHGPKTEARTEDRAEEEDFSFFN